MCLSQVGQATRHLSQAHPRQLLWVCTSALGPECPSWRERPLSPPTAHLTSAGHPACARYTALAAGRFRVPIRLPHDLEHHFCWAQWEAAG